LLPPGRIGVPPEKSSVATHEPPTRLGPETDVGAPQVEVSLLIVKSIGSDTRIIPLFQVEVLSLKIVPPRINGEEAVVLALKTGSTAD